MIASHFPLTAFDIVASLVLVLVTLSELVLLFFFYLFIFSPQVQPYEHIYIK